MQAWSCGLLILLSNTMLCGLVRSVIDDDGASMVSQYTIATVSHAGMRHGGRPAPLSLDSSAPWHGADEPCRKDRRFGLRAALCLALAALAAYTIKVHRALPNFASLYLDNSEIER